jgi:hypothetical protein
MPNTYEAKTRHLPMHFSTKPVPYLRRPRSRMVSFSYELMRLCACVLLVLILAAALVLAVRR